MILLEITLTDGWIISFLILFALSLYVNWTNYGSYKDTKNYQQSKILELENKLQKNDMSYKIQLNARSLEFEKRVNDFKTNINDLAIKEFEKFKQNELQAYTTEIKKVANESAMQLLAEWKLVAEDELRKDAAKRSRAITLGQVVEHLIPFSEMFHKFNPKDARFVGNPIDLIVFDGMTDNKENVTVYFIEIKTGNSPLNEIQKKLRYSIENKNVKWETIRMDTLKV